MANIQILQKKTGKGNKKMLLRKSADGCKQTHSIKESPLAPNLATYCGVVVHILNFPPKLTFIWMALIFKIKLRTYVNLKNDKQILL